MTGASLKPFVVSLSNYKPNMSALRQAQDERG
jgi:hypothetical protein